MEVTRDPAPFRPVTIRLETEDELDKLIAALNNVACNVIHHTPQVVRAAIEMVREIEQQINKDD